MENKLRKLVASYNYYISNPVEASLTLYEKKREALWKYYRMNKGGMVASQKKRLF